MRPPGEEEDDVPEARATPVRPTIPTSSLGALGAEQLASLIAFDRSTKGRNFYEILCVEPNATQQEIQKAFFHESRGFHPDRFFHLQDDSAKRLLYNIYKRMTEAYYVLRDQTRRREYDSWLATKQNQTAAVDITGDPDVRDALRKAVRACTDPRTRAFLKTIMTAGSNGDFRGAQAALRSAISFEAGNSDFQSAVERVRDALARVSNRAR